jgi:hypothetical protein
MNITLNKGDFRHPDLFWGAVEDLILTRDTDITQYLESEEQLDDILTVEVFIKELDYETGLEDNYITVKFANQDSKSISL